MVYIELLLIYVYSFEHGVLSLRYLWFLNFEFSHNIHVWNFKGILIQMLLLTNSDAELAVMK